MKKSKWIKIILASALAMSMVGCGNNTVITVKPEAETEIETESEIETETETETETLFTELQKIETEKKEIIKVQGPYKEILDYIYNTLNSSEDLSDIYNDYFSTGIAENTASIDNKEDRLKAIAYCIADINKDGVKELIIVDNIYPKSGNKRILDIFTLSNGKAIKVVEGWARNRYYLLDDGTIYNESSSGAAYSSDELFELAPGSTELTSIELYFTYPDEETRITEYYYSKSGEYDVAKATKISEDEFMYFQNDCNRRIVKFDATSFDLLK